MPAQQPGATVAQYSENDTAPNLRRQLKDGEGNPIDLTGATVTITIGWMTWNTSAYYAPTKKIVEESPCVPDPDQIANTGWVDWVPSGLTPPGDYGFTFKIIYPGGGLQTIPPNTYEPFHINSPVGGRSRQI